MVRVRLLAGPARQRPDAPRAECSGVAAGARTSRGAGGRRRDRPRRGERGSAMRGWLSTFTLGLVMLLSSADTWAFFRDEVEDGAQAVLAAELARRGVSLQAVALAAICCC